MAEQAALILFDVDGTLVDSNYLHTIAWSRTRRAEAAGGHRGLGASAYGFQINTVSAYLGDVGTGYGCTTLLGNEPLQEGKEHLSASHGRATKDPLPSRYCRRDGQTHPPPDTRRA